MNIFSLVHHFRRLIIEKRIRLLCAKCGKEWRGGHGCENKKKEAGG
jgi:hypothetical protein